VALAEKLDDIAPFDEDAMVFFTNSGTESNECAIKLARYHTKKTNFIGFLGGFHGRTMGSVTFTASKAKYHRGFYPLMNGVTHVPYPDTYRPILERRAGEEYGETVVRYINDKILGQLVPHEDLAGFLVESIQGEGGYIVPCPSFFPALRKLCDKYGILIISDEVQSGMGRTGKWWAIQHFGVEPDIVSAAKGIASGVPLGACIARKSVMDWPVGAHGNTYGGNPIACAASLATIDVLEETGLSNATEQGNYIMGHLKGMAQKHTSIGDVRGIGLMIGVDFVKDKKTREPAHDFREKVVTKAYERGLLLLPCSESVIRFSPPLTISRAEVDEGLAIFEESLMAAERE